MLCIDANIIAFLQSRHKEKSGEKKLIPLTVSVSPAVWDVLETEENIINEAVTKIDIPEFSGQQDLVKYRIWDGRVDYFSVPKTGASFQDMQNGVHISIKGVKFRATVKGRVELGKKVFGKWVQIARMSGDIKATSESADLDVVLVWEDFKFVPTVTLHSNFRIDFTHHLRNLNFLHHEIQKRVKRKVDEEAPKKIVEVINNQVNPQLQKVKQKMIAKGYVNYDMEWAVENNSLRISVKPK